MVTGRQALGVQYVPSHREQHVRPRVRWNSPGELCTLRFNKVSSLPCKVFALEERLHRLCTSSTIAT